MVGPNGGIVKIVGASDTSPSSAYNRLKAPAKSNARQMDEIDCFVKAMKAVKAHVQQNKDGGGGGRRDGNDDDDNDNNNDDDGHAQL